MNEGQRIGARVPNYLAPHPIATLPQSDRLTCMKIPFPMPTFVLAAHDNVRVSSDTLLERSPLVVFFYPKDNTTGCTLESCAFRDHSADFAACGATLVGISADDPQSHTRFREKYNLPYLLLSDPGGEVALQFGVKRTFGLLAGRETFVVDKQGKVQWRLRSQLRPLLHVQEALKAVRNLA